MQISEMEIQNDEDRIFKSWGSVEVRDKEGDLIPMNEFRKVMNTLMSRGGIITDQHSNRVVAKILNYEFKDKETLEGSREGIMITGMVFKDYDLDDLVWEGIKKGIYQGLSFGGRNKEASVKYEKGGDLTQVLKQLEGYEFGLVPSMGNQEATMDSINYLAKSEVQKGKNGESINHSILSKMGELCEKFIKNNELNKVMTKDVEKEGEEIMPQEQPESNPMDEIKQLLQSILERLPAPQEKAEDEEKPEEEDKPEIEKEEDKDEKPKEKKPEDEKDVEKEGEKVVLPKTPEEKTESQKPAEGAEQDKVKLVEKMKEDIKKDILKSLKINESATTPKPGADNLINKKGLEVSSPKNFAEGNKMIRAMVKQ